jgi:hypothetical protein
MLIINAILIILRNILVDVLFRGHAIAYEYNGDGVGEKVGYLCFCDCGKLLAEKRRQRSGRR